MSAFMVSTEHIDMMITAGQMYHPQHGPFSWHFDGERHYLTNETRDAAGQMLLSANQASVNFRYSENDEVEEYHFTRLQVAPPTHVEALKGINCFQYQACEVPNWQETQAYAFCQSLTASVIRELPGYEEAPREWSVGMSKRTAERTAE